MSVWFSKKDIVCLHSLIISETGGQDGTRDEAILESALGAPLQTFDSVDLYPTIVDKIIRLSYGLVMNHPFIDGNKRIGAYALYVGFKLNGIHCSFEDEEAASEFLSLAAGEISYDSFASWVRSKIN